MVKSVEVKNFKSIVDLKLELGRVNVFIGENGSGKSNILEAVAFGSAASANKLDKEFLASRGMRVPEPKLMRSAFSKENLDKSVEIEFQIVNSEKEISLDLNYNINHDNGEFSKWEDYGESLVTDINFVNGIILNSNISDVELEKYLTTIEKTGRFKTPAIAKFKDLKNEYKNYDAIENNDNAKNQILAVMELFNDRLPRQPSLIKYKIFAPENTFLRKFEDEEAGDPLGIKGEGLFRLLRYFIRNEDKKYIEAIKEAMTALDWFEDFNIADDLSAGERKLRIIDRFLDPDVSISQNSANEGFLFILFYLSLFVSPDTPPFFAIDNLDASFNPKLCKQITRVLIKTAKDFDKQALFTTHNPFILDGLELTDDEQRLFVVYRSQKGHTIAKRVLPNDRKMPLSEQWMNGYIGGLPQNF